MHGHFSRFSASSILVQIIRSNAFGKYMDFYGKPLMDVASTNAVKNILVNYPDLDIRHKKYRYYANAQARLNEDFAKVLMNTPAFSLLDALKTWAAPRIVEEILN